MSGAKRVEISLVLQGGGALGAYECGAVIALLDRMDAAEREDNRSVVLTGVSGVSIGAVNAACLVGSADRDDARARLRRLWDLLQLETLPIMTDQVRRDLSLFGVPGFFQPRVDYWNAPAWTSFYDTRPLLTTLSENVDFVQLNNSPTGLTVSAVDLVTGRLTRFRNEAARVQASEPSADGEIRPVHILASGSLAPQFPAVEVNGAHYWDGGLVDNAPLGTAIDAFSTDSGVDRLLVVLNLYPLRGKLPASLADVQDRVHELSFGNRSRQDTLNARRVNRLVSAIDRLAELVPSEAMPPDLAREVARARLYRVVTVVDIDLQSPVDQPPFDDDAGLRDFSAATVARRRELGYRVTTEVLTRYL